MKISVVIPARNAGETIVKCLDSIAAQDFDRTEYEALVAFDSCTDNTEQTARAWSALHPDVNVRFFACACGSPGGARNVCLDNATGEYVMFVDADDRLINPSAMSILYGAAQGHNAVRVTDHEVRGSMVKFSERPTIWLHFFSRALIGADRFTDMQLCEDYEFVKRIREKAGYDEAIVSVPLYFYEYDDKRMKDRIRSVVAESRQREAQGLSPLYVSDGFIPEGAKRAMAKWRS